MKQTTVLRERFLRYLQLKRLSPRTIESYTQSVIQLSRYYNSSPDRLSLDQVQDYLLYLFQDRKLAWSSCNVALSAFCVFFIQMLGFKKWRFKLPPRPRVKQLPMLLSLDEVSRILNATNNLKHKAMLYTVYSAGLRVKELTVLRKNDIDSHPKRMVIRVNQGKGRKDRYTTLAKSLLPVLRAYWKTYQLRELIFPGRDITEPISVSSVQKVFYDAKRKAGITKGRGIHTLRHCFASHLMDDGVNIYTIKKLLGHRNIKTTWRYCHVSDEQIQRLVSPLDELYKNV